MHELKEEATAQQRVPYTCNSAAPCPIYMYITCPIYMYIFFYQEIHKLQEDASAQQSVLIYVYIYFLYFYFYQEMHELQKDASAL
jgi:amino acid permease